MTEEEKAQEVEDVLRGFDPRRKVHILSYTAEPTDKHGNLDAKAGHLCIIHTTLCGTGGANAQVSRVLKDVTCKRCIGRRAFPHDELLPDPWKDGQVITINEFRAKR